MKSPEDTGLLEEWAKEGFVNIVMDVVVLP